MPDTFILSPYTMNRTMLARLREQYESKKMEKEKEESPELINTKFQDNHGIVVSGGQNTINITFGSDGAMQMKMERQSAEDRISALTTILQSLDSGSQMFCVLKGIVLAGKAGNLAGADIELRKLYPNGLPFAKSYDVSRLETDLHVRSFTKPVEMWDLDESPLKSRSVFSKYQFITHQVKDLFLAL